MPAPGATMNKPRKARKPKAPAEATPSEPLSFPIIVRPHVRTEGEDRPHEESPADYEKRLQMIQELASYQFDPKDIAIVVQIQPEDMTGRDDGATLAYNSGRLLAEAQVRRMLLEMAKAGSGPAQKMILEIAETNKRKLNKDGDADPSGAELSAVRQHLQGLNLAAQATPTIELARLAALRIVELEGKVRYAR